MKRLVRWLRQPIPLTVATALFCFLEGAMLSIPVALCRASTLPFDLPQPRMQAIIDFAFGATLVMPIWCVVMGRKHTTMAWIGITTFLLVIGLGFLFPRFG